MSDFGFRKLNKIDRDGIKL
jgi:hypothetical protein